MSTELQAPPGGACLAASRPPRILVVEDNEGIRELLTLVLKRRGYDIVALPDACSALQLVREQPGSLALILLDVMMPGMSGLDFLRSFADRSALPPVLVMSALSDAGSIAEALGLGALDYVAKPIEMELLVYKVRALLSENQETSYRMVALPPGTIVTVGQATGTGTVISEIGMSIEVRSSDVPAIGETVMLSSPAFRSVGLPESVHARITGTTFWKGRSTLTVSFVGTLPTQLNSLRRFILHR